MQFSFMSEADVDEIMLIEEQAFDFPWSRQNFIDALHAQYQGLCVRSTDLLLHGYILFMMVVDEIHILNFCVAPQSQGQGLGSALLKELIAYAAQSKMYRILLEVRATNESAITVYTRWGFQQIGCRKAYYPTHQGREDALMMLLSLDHE